MCKQSNLVIRNNSDKIGKTKRLNPIIFRNLKKEKQHIPIQVEIKYWSDIQNILVWLALNGPHCTCCKIYCSYNCKSVCIFQESVCFFTVYVYCVLEEATVSPHRYIFADCITDVKRELFFQFMLSKCLSSLFLNYLR